MSVYPFPPGRKRLLRMNAMRLSCMHERIQTRELRFTLLKQRLLELVRRGETDEALRFAAERLAPEGAGDAAMLRQIEEAITLLAFKVQFPKAPSRVSCSNDIVSFRTAVRYEPVSWHYGPS